MSTINLRRMEANDLNSVLAIEESTQVVPWSRGIFFDCLRIGYDCWVLEQEAQVLAFAIMTNKAAEERHLLNLSVKPAAQRQGHGSQLLDHVLNIAKVGQAERIILEVRRSNEPAYRLYQYFGFKLIGERKRYYKTPSGYEDALVLALELDH